MNREEVQALADKLMKGLDSNIKLKLDESFFRRDDPRFILEVGVYQEGEVNVVFAVEYLPPEEAHLHTYRMFADAIQRAHAAGVMDGLKIGAERLDKANRTIIFSPV